MLKVSLATLLLVTGLASLQSPIALGHFLGLLGLAVLFTISTCALRRDQWLIVAAGVLSIGALIAIPALWQAAHGFRARGTFLSADYLAGWALLSIFLGLLCAARGGAWRLFGHTMAALNTLLLVVSEGRGAFLALGAALMILSPQVAPRVRWLSGIGILAAILIVSIFRPGLSLDNPRVGLWILAARIWGQRPLLGWGYNFAHLDGLGHFYSVPLDWTVRAGVLGLVAFAWVIVEAFRAAWRLPQRERAASAALLVAYLVNGLFISDAPATLVPLLVALGFLLSPTRNVADVPRGIDHRQPFLDGGVGAGGARRRHNGGDAAVDREAVGVREGQLAQLGR